MSIFLLLILGTGSFLTVIIISTFLMLTQSQSPQTMDVILGQENHS